MCLHLNYAYHKNQKILQNIFFFKNNVCIAQKLLAI